MPTPPRWLPVLLHSMALACALALLVFPMIPERFLHVRKPALRADPTPVSDLLLIHRSHVTTRPFHTLWALEGFRRIPFPVRGALALILAIAAAATLRSAAASTPTAERSTASQNAAKILLVAGAAGLVAAIVFFALRVNPLVNATFGDGPALPANVEQGRVSPPRCLRFASSTMCCTP
jgi:hypothetical protein